MDYTYKSIAAGLATGSLLAVSGAVTAAEGELDALMKPDNVVSVGVGLPSGELHRSGVYSGMGEKRPHLNGDVVLNRRDESTGTWLTLTGTNLGLDTREARFDYARQGDWSAFIDYSRTPRVSPYSFMTGLQGIGTPTQTVTSAGRREVKLETVREGWTVGLEKSISDRIGALVRYKTEDKDGSRPFGRGNGGQLEFLAEPVHSTTRQLDANLSYTDDQLQVLGGYYGTTYINHNPALYVTSGVAMPANCQAAANIACFNPVTLPPGNASHQLFVSGGYNFAPKTRGTFKVAYSRATQDESFISPSALQQNTSGRSTLDGRVDTKLVQFGISSRPLPKLSLNASFRYDDRSDKTPVTKYFGNAAALAAGSTLTGENEPRSLTTTTSKLEASYQLPKGFRLSGGVDFEKKKRNVSDVRSVSAREETSETTARIDLRRSLSDTLSGSVSYARSDRDGQAFLRTNTLNGAAGSNLIAPTHLADRQRDKVAMLLNWNPLDPLSIQFSFSDTSDTYGKRSAFGVHNGGSNNFAVDATYAMTEKWRFTGWFSSGQTDISQSTSSGGEWRADLRTETDAAGFGVRGKPTGKIEIGGDLQMTVDRDRYKMTRIGAGAAVNSLPDIYTKRTVVSLFGAYALEPNAQVRLDFVRDRWRTDDWTWDSYTYLAAAIDGTTVVANKRQISNFVGARYIYKWQ